MGKKYPEPPDPKETARQQTSTNLSTAQANAIFGNVNQVTPYGSLTYTESGRKFINDDNGQTYWRGPKGEITDTGPVPTVTPSVTNTQRVLERDPHTNAPRYVNRNVTKPETSTIPTGWSQVKGYYIPQFTATTKLSPEQQALLNKSQAAQMNLADLAKDRSAFLKTYLSKPFSLSNSAVEGRLFDLGRKRLDPMFAEQHRALEQRLADQGIAIGSEAYRTAAKQESEGRNDAYNQLLLSGRQQAVSELSAERNQPINEIMALLSGSQVTNPTWAPATMPTIPTTDIAGLINENFNQKMGIAQQKNAAMSGILGGLFGLGSAFIGRPRFA